MRCALGQRPFTRQLHDEQHQVNCCSAAPGLLFMAASTLDSCNNAAEIQCLHREAIAALDNYIYHQSIVCPNITPPFSTVFEKFNRSAALKGDTRFATNTAHGVPLNRFVPVEIPLQITVSSI